MVRRTLHTAAILACLFSLTATPSAGQMSPDPSLTKSPAKALGLSLLVPGLGHRYVNDGSWSGTASVLAGLDVAVLLGLTSSAWGRTTATSTFETLAATKADVALEGKSRGYFLNVGNYASSDEYIDALLRARNWENLPNRDDPDFAWNWSSEEDRTRYRELRADAESLGRRVSIFGAAMVANRLISGVLALRSAQRANRSSDVMVMLVPSSRLDGGSVRLSLSF